jgi:hypothetical protein
MLRHAPLFLSEAAAAVRGTNLARRPRRFDRGDSGQAMA